MTRSSILLSLSLAWFLGIAHAQTPGPQPGSGGSGSPTGAAGGDLSGTYPNPGVAKIDGTSVPATPSANQALIATGSTAATWETVPVAAGGTGATAAGATAANNIGALAEASNLSDLASTSAALTNLGIPTTYCALAGCTMTGQFVAAAGSSSAPGLSISGTGTGFYQYAANEPCLQNFGSLVWCNVGTKMLIGSTSNLFSFSSNPDLEIDGTHAPLIASFFSTTGSAQNNIYFIRSAGASVGTHGALVSGNGGSILNFYGDDGTNYDCMANIQSNVTGTVSTSIIPSNMLFFTANSSGTCTQALALDQSQNSIFAGSGLFKGTTSPVTASGQAGIYATTANGAFFTGKGTSVDVQVGGTGGAAYGVYAGSNNGILYGQTQSNGTLFIVGGSGVGLSAGQGQILAGATNGLYLQGNGVGGTYDLLLAGASTNVIASPTGTGNLKVFNLLEVSAFTVSTLPTCNSGTAGAIAYVTDASSPTYNGNLSGGSSTKTLAMCNGTNWTAH